MPSSNPRQRFRDILDSIEDIEYFTNGLTKDEFRADRKTRFAVERAVSILSEAAIKLGDDAATYAPNIPWQDIRGIGNHIRHAYDTVSPETIWEILTDHLPPLKAACVAALDQLTAQEASENGRSP